MLQSCQDRTLFFCYYKLVFLIDFFDQLKNYLESSREGRGAAGSNKFTLLSPWLKKIFKYFSLYLIVRHPVEIFYLFFSPSFLSLTLALFLAVKLGANWILQDLRPQSVCIRIAIILIGRQQFSKLLLLPPQHRLLVNVSLILFGKTSSFQKISCYHSSINLRHSDWKASSSQNCFHYHLSTSQCQLILFGKTHSFQKVLNYHS